MLRAILEAKLAMGPDLHSSGMGARERRAIRRYPVQVRIRYRVDPGDGRVITGFGRTLDISSHGLLFQAAEPLPAGAGIEAEIPWPARNSNWRLKAAIKGRIIRAEDKSTAMVIEEQHFQRIKLRDLIPPSRN